MTQNIPRRQVVEMLAAGLVVLGGMRPDWKPPVGPAPDDDAELTAWLRQHLERVDLAPVATAWWQRHPNETSEVKLVELLLHGRRRSEPLSDHLARRVSSEHAAGQAEPLDGWFLAPTEARLAALLQLGRTP